MLFLFKIILCYNAFMKKIIKNTSMTAILLVVVAIFLANNSVLAQETQAKGPETFRAKVIKVIEEKSEVRENNSISYLQVLKLEIKDGSLKGQEVVYDGQLYDVLSAPRYKVNDKVIINKSYDADGNEVYYVTDYDRSNVLIWLAVLFAVFVVIVGKLKGLRALIVLVLTFLIVLKFIIPYILAGKSPLIVSIVGSLVILLVATYLTEGFNRRSHIAVSAIFISLVITGLLSILFISLANLTGFTSEDVMFLVSSSTGGAINIKGLLLAGIIIGALGVLDDVVIAQIVLVEELSNVNKKLNNYELYKKAMVVGVSHLASMANTLFLAYAGASLPLLILFSSHTGALTLMQALSTEAIATEVVRTFVGSIGLVLAIPIATVLAVKFRENNNLK